jgi:hypothetical protein
LAAIKAALKFGFLLAEGGDANITDGARFRHAFPAITFIHFAKDHLGMHPRTSYVICTNPRSGSWLLSEGLESTQVAGRPQEWFHEVTQHALCQQAGLQDPDRVGYGAYVAHVKKATQTANGVFGLEFLYNDIGVFSPVDCDAPDLARWPLFEKAAMREVVLSPGEVLFIPVGWWHHVRALDVSITVSFTNFRFANHYEWSMPQIRK